MYVCLSPSKCSIRLYYVVVSLNNNDYILLLYIQCSIYNDGSGTIIIIKYQLRGHVHNRINNRLSSRRVFEQSLYQSTHFMTSKGTKLSQRQLISNFTQAIFK